MKFITIIITTITIIIIIIIIWKFAGKMPQTKTGRTVLCKPAESKCTQKSFMQQFTNEMPQTKAGTTVLREPAQSKYTWTYEKKYERILK